MKVTLTSWKESATCSWCDKTKECVTAEFSDGFLAKGPLCWPCLQKSVRARTKQATSGQKNKEQAETAAQ